MSEKQRYHFFDGLRVICAILVILVHCCSSMYYNYPNIDSGVADVIFSINGITRFALLNFFMISGALMLRSKKNDSIKYVLAHRVLRLLVVLAVFSVIYYAFNNLYIEHNGFDIKLFIRRGLQNAIEVKFWYIYALMGMYLATPIIRVVVEKAPRKYLWYMVALGLFGTYFIYDVETRLNVNVYFSMPLVGGFLAVYILGYLLNTMEIKKEYRYIIYVLGILGCVFRTVITKDLSIRDNEFNTDWFNDRTFNVLMSATSLFVFAKYSKMFEKFSKFKVTKALANATLGVYLIHPLVINYIKFKSNWIPQDAMDVTVSDFVMMSLITIVVSFLISYVLSKIKYIKKLVS